MAAGDRLEDLRSSTEVLRAFCHLVVRDGLGASAILRTQLRHAINLADYISARVPSTRPRLSDDTRVLTVLEQQLEHGLRKSLDAARQSVYPEDWAADPIEAFSTFIEARAHAEAIEQQVLENFARVTRSLRCTPLATCRRSATS